MDLDVSVKGGLSVLGRGKGKRWLMWMGWSEWVMVEVDGAEL